MLKFKKDDLVVKSAKFSHALGNDENLIEDLVVFKILSGCVDKYAGERVSKNPYAFNEYNACNTKWGHTVKLFEGELVPFRERKKEYIEYLEKQLKNIKELK